MPTMQAKRRPASEISSGEIGQVGGIAGVSVAIAIAAVMDFSSLWLSCKTHGYPYRKGSRSVRGRMDGVEMKLGSEEREMMVARRMGEGGMGDGE